MSPADPIARAGGLSPARRLGLIAIVALIAMLPELIAGLSPTDSFVYNLEWTAQFTEQVLAGDPYPRWLVRAWDGMGAPSFYHYPPLFFWVAAVVRLVGLDLLPVSTLISLTSAVLMAASGLAMAAWLRRVAPAAAAMPGAVAYMLAPYHLYDIYGRGALAETCTYAALPLLLIGLHTAGESGRGGARAVAGIALAYALLLLGHLPSTLIATLTLVPAYVLFRAAAAPAGAVLTIARALAGGVLGLGLAAAYLVPAVALLPHISAEAFGGRWYLPENWLFTHPERWPSSGRMVLVILFVAAALLVPLAAYAARDREVDTRGPRFWALVAIGLFAMIAGLIPGVWRLPGLVQVQFPSRLMPAAELVAITAVAIAMPRWRSPPMLVGSAVAGIAFVAALVVIGNRTELGFATARTAAARIVATPGDAPEYLPPGYPLPVEDDMPPDPSRARLPEPGWLARGAGANVRVRQEGEAMEIAVDATAPTFVVARRMAHPRWRVVDAAGREIAWAPTKPARMPGWRVPAGRSRYRLEPRRLPAERIGWALSALAAALTGGWWLAARRRPRISASCTFAR